jgi:predicted ribosome quality control (RQC) complex YloA/Tae2 family protein
MKTISKYIQSLNQYVVYYVGENAEDNFAILDKADPHDIWFHVQGFSSGHVIADIRLLDPNKKQLRQIITQGAMLCKQHSNYSYMSDLAIIYTRVKDVQKTEIVGTVLTKQVKVRII